MTALWPHQSDAVAAATDRLRAGGRATVIMACGTGKTRVGSETAQRLGAARVLVAVPTLELLAQTVHAYRLEHGDQALGRIIAVCSDQTITRRHEIDLRAEHADVTTDSEQLHELCSGKGRRTVFSTYASLPTAVAGAHRDQACHPGISQSSMKRTGPSGTTAEHGQPSTTTTGSRRGAGCTSPLLLE